MVAGEDIRTLPKTWFCISSVSYISFKFMLYILYMPTVCNFAGLGANKLF